MEVELDKPFRFPTFDDFLIEKETLDTLALHDFDIKSGLDRFFKKYDMKDETHMFDDRIDLKEIQDYSNRHVENFLAAPETPKAVEDPTATTTDDKDSDEDEDEDIINETMKFAETKNFIERHIMRINDLKLINFIKVLRKFKNLLDTNESFFEAIEDSNKANKQKNEESKKQVDAIKSTSENLINTVLAKQIKEIIEKDKPSDHDVTKEEIDAILKSIKTEIRKSNLFNEADNKTIDETTDAWSNAEMEIVESEYFNYSNTVFCFLATKFGYKKPEEECLFFKSKNGGFFDKLMKNVENGLKNMGEIKEKAVEARKKEKEEAVKLAGEEKDRLEKEAKIKLIDQIMQSGAKEAQKVFQKIIDATKTGRINKLKMLQARFFKDDKGVYKIETTRTDIAEQNYTSFFSLREMFDDAKSTDLAKLHAANYENIVYWNDENTITRDSMTVSGGPNVQIRFTTSSKTLATKETSPNSAAYIISDKNIKIDYENDVFELITQESNNKRVSIGASLTFYVKQNNNAYKKIDSNLNASLQQKINAKNYYFLKLGYIL